MEMVRALLRLPGLARAAGADGQIDQTEALTFADTVVVMHDGSVVQSGTPEELFAKPAHTFVGYFIGSIVPPFAASAGSPQTRRHQSGPPL